VWSSAGGGLISSLAVIFRVPLGLVELGKSCKYKLKDSCKCIGPTLFLLCVWDLDGDTPGISFPFLACFCTLRGRAWETASELSN